MGALARRLERGPELLDLDRLRAARGAEALDGETSELLVGGVSRLALEVARGELGTELRDRVRRVREREGLAHLLVGGELLADRPELAQGLVALSLRLEELVLELR